MRLPGNLTARLLAGGAAAALSFSHPTAASAQSAESSEEQPAEAEEAEEEDIIVQATRSRRRVQDEPIRVEVLNREEIEEKLLMRPGNIAMLLSETGGVRVQVTSPALGAANVRVQGMNGGYTQLLSDSLPLYGGQASSLGLLQIPPTDLGQVEVIKGAASALYGPSALGGVINLVSRRPGDAPEGELLFDVTSRDGQDLTGYAAAPLGAGWSGSVTGGLHRQSRHDLDEDGWIDIPSYRRWTVRPRLFWEGAEGASLFATIGGMGEERVGGTVPGRTTPDGRPFVQAQDTDRLDGGLVAEVPLQGVGRVQLRASGTRQGHRHRFGNVVEDDRHATIFAEASIAGEAGRTNWVAGLAYQADSYRSEAFPLFDYDFTVPGLFVQAEHELSEQLTLAGSARVDAHSDYGTQFSPRFSVLYRPGYWTIRASVGGGFYAPTPFVDEIEAAGLSRLEPLRGLRAEMAQSASLDIGYARGPVEANVTLFGSNMSDTARLDIANATPGAERVRLVNVAEQTRIRGGELLLRYRWDGFTVTGSYVYVDSSEPEPGGIGRRAVPLTPRHTAGAVAMWEREGVGRLGFEAYYTGEQLLEDNPFRSTGRPYVELGLLGEVVLGKVRLFVNAENLLDVRQTNYDPLLRPARAPDGRWTVDVWGPTDGFVVNGGIRLSFGGDLGEPALRRRGARNLAAQPRLTVGVSLKPIPFDPNDEVIEDGEEELFRALAGVMDFGTKHARDADCRYGRRSHVKCLGALEGQLRVWPDLDTALAQGMFSRPASYPVLARFSHLPAEQLDDRNVSSVRGLALRVSGVAGRPLEGHEGDTQDFVLDTGTSFNARNPRTLLAGMATVEASGPLPQGFKAAVSHTARAVNAALEQVGLASANLDVLGHARRHPLSEGYYSQAPLRWGGYVAKLAVIPEPVVEGKIAADDPDALRTGMQSWCAANETRLVVAVQLRVDADAMPIENARKEWPEALSPYVPVGEIVFPRQDALEPARQHLVDACTFSPWRGMEEHRPLGAIMRARKYVYRVLGEKRLREMNAGG